ncbi:MAG: tRNA (cytidine(34)-2'-O)-methyltransferase [Parachlamydiaceae bacterium]
MKKIILYQPQIPQNAGNIVRTCSVTGSELCFVRPTGFATTDRHLKRAGLDYWEGVKVTFCDDFEAYLNEAKHPFYFFSSKAKRGYADVKYEKDCDLIFGSESNGLPEWVHEKYSDRFLRIPMLPEARCLNLATSVGIVLYESLRQEGFDGIF